MIADSTLDMIIDTLVEQTYTITVTLDVERTPEMIGSSGKTFAPNELRVSWSKTNESVWHVTMIRLSGPSTDRSWLREGHVRWNGRDLEDHRIPAWVWEIASETKPKE